jgi:TolB-like protein
VSIAPQVFDLLDFLIRNRERVVSKDDLMNAIWNGRIVSDAALTTRLNAARSAIGDTGEKQRLIKTLPRKGFRFVGAVQEVQRPAIAPVSSAAENDDTAQRPFSPPHLSIVVLPFANLSDDPAQDYFADGITESLTTDLSRIRGSFVIGRHTAFTYKGKSTNLRQIGQELGVRYVLEGSVQRSGNRLLMFSTSMRNRRTCGLTVLTTLSPISSTCRTRSFPGLPTLYMLNSLSRRQDVRNDPRTPVRWTCISRERPGCTRGGRRNTRQGLAGFLSERLPSIRTTSRRRSGPL